MLNKITLIGNLGKDPEEFKTQKGDTGCRFSIATTEKWSGGEQTTWFDVSAFGKQAEIILDHASKGTKLYLEGAMSYRDVEKDDGSKARYWGVRMREFKFLGGRNEEGGAPAPKASQPAQRPIADDDIPF